MFFEVKFLSPINCKTRGKNLSLCKHKVIPLAPTCKSCFVEHGGRIRMTDKMGHNLSFATPPAMKVNRNDSCPCGSGKKYKKCCYLHPNVPRSTNKA